MCIAMPCRFINLEDLCPWQSALSSGGLAALLGAAAASAIDSVNQVNPCAQVPRDTRRSYPVCTGLPGDTLVAPEASPSPGDSAGTKEPGVGSPGEA